MKRPLRRLLEISLLLLMAGCQTPPPAPAPEPPPAPVCPEVPPPPEVAELKAVLGYAEELRKALALSQGRGGADLAQAAAQVEVLATDPQAEALRPLATLVVVRLADQRRLQDSIDKLTQQLRDSQRRNEQLNDKLEALKAIEQILPAKR